MRRYKGKELTAKVEADGGVRCLGQAFHSLSLAAGHARASVVGVPPGRKYPPTNGWGFWKFRGADGSLKVIDVVRRDYVRGAQLKRVE